MQRSGHWAIDRNLIEQTARMKETIASPDPAALDVAATLALAIQTSAEWRALNRARQAANEDALFVHLIRRHDELTRLQNAARENGGTFQGMPQAELVSVRDQIQRHEIYRDQQVALRAVVELFRQINNRISAELGIDFASNVGPQCGCSTGLTRNGDQPATTVS